MNKFQLSTDNGKTWEDVSLPINCLPYHQLQPRRITRGDAILVVDRTFYAEGENFYRKVERT